MLSTIKERLIHFLAKNLMPIVEADDVLAFTKRGELFLDGKQLTAGELNNLKREAEFLSQSQLWKIINKYFLRLAHKKVYTDSKDISDLLFAKTVVYTLDVQSSIVDRVRNAK